MSVHGVDVDGKIAVRRKLKRSDVISFFKSLPSCLVGIEACATAHYWARELIVPVKILVPVLLLTSAFMALPVRCKFWRRAWGQVN